MLQRLFDKLSNLRPQQLGALAVLAAVLMIATIYLAFKFGFEEEVAQPPSEPPKVVETVPVVVAKSNIQPRTRIQDTMLQMKELPIEMVPEGAIKNFDDVRNVQVKVSIFAGDILTIQKVFAEGDEGFAGSIPADCRAVSINVNEVTGVAGFAKPGDRVDLLLVEKGKYTATTNLLLQNVPLLSINQDTAGSSSVGEDGMAPAAINNPSIATFALQPQDALKLISASKLGEIYISLRPSKPQSAYVEEMYYTIESIDAPKPEPVREPEPTPIIPSSAPVMPLPQLPEAPAVPKIEIIAGDKVVQSNEPTTPVAPSSTRAGGPTTTQPLPVIPSRGGITEYSAPSVPQTPLANSPIVNR